MEPIFDSAFASFLPNATEDDKALIVKFFVKPKLMGLKSHEAGHEVYEDREYIEIKIKGQDKQVVSREATAQDKKKYPVAYYHFVQAKPAPVVGAPIEQLPGIGPSMALRLKQLNIRTIEDMSAISDEAALQAIGGGARDMVKRAKAFLEKTSAETVSLAEENKALKEQIEKDRADFAARLAALEATAAAKPRRQRKKPVSEVTTTPPAPEMRQ